MPSSPGGPVSIQSFANHQLSLLATEQDAETAQTASLLSSSAPALLAAAGLAVTNLVLTAQRTGLGGKTVVELSPDPALLSSSSTQGDGKDVGGVGQHGVRVGDIVRVAEQPRGAERKREKKQGELAGVEGVVVSVRANGLQIALQEGKGKGGEEQLDGLMASARLWVVKLANDVTYRRMNQTMERMAKMQEREHTTLMQILFGLASPTPLDDDEGDVQFVDPTLNDSQKDAIWFALASREVALIHGPPGTGKTYTLIELILQLLQRQQRVLVCGPSNISVDNIVERLAPHRIPIVRIGHPARLLPSVLNHSLDVLTHTSEAAGLVKDVCNEMDSKQASIKKTRNGRERREIYGDIRELRKEYRLREQQCVSNLVHGSKVVLATLHGAGGHQLKGEVFDVVIIDESSQALEAQSWIPLVTAKKAVLAGDHLQLPPTVKSSSGASSKTPFKTDTDKEKGSDITLEDTLFSRLLHLHGPSIKRMLTVQYRMHSTICAFPSKELYEGRLVAAPSVADRLLPSLPYEVEDTEDTREPLIFYDTQGGDFPEITAVPDTGGREESSQKAKSRSIMLADSKSNPSEAALAAHHVKSLVKAGVRAENIAVITPYNAQLSLLSNILKTAYPALELGSVDGFQGREKEAVVLSLVRSNVDASGAEVGFLAEKRRLNVAMTRPRRQLCVIGDSETVGKGSAFLKKWMDYLEKEADLRYPDVTDISNQS